MTVDHVPGGPPTSNTFELSLLTVLTLLLRRARTVGVIGIAGMLAGIAVGLLTGTSYTATATFKPDLGSASALSRYAGLAAQFGVSLPGNTSEESLEYYLTLLESGDLLDSLAFTIYTVTDHDTTAHGTLPQLYNIDRDDQDEYRIAAIKRAQDLLTVKPSPEAGTITLSVTSDWPQLSRAMLTYAIDRLNIFNLRTRQTRASAERTFVEGRVEVARSELEAAEAELEAFHRRNRSFTGAPHLELEAARLQRRVDLRQQVHVSLAEAYENARIEEVRSTPVITIIDGPSGPIDADSDVLLYAALGAFLAVTIAVLLILGLAYFTMLGDSTPTEVAQFRLAVRSLLPGFFGRPS